MLVPYDLYDYASYWENRSFEDQAERIALKKFFNIIGKKEKFLDIGGGFGRLASLYSQYFSSCTILEPSEKLIEIAKEKLKEIENISIKKGGLPGLPFEKDFFDAVMMVRVIHHFEDSSEVINKVAEILKTNGYFILEVANKIHFLARIKAIIKGNFSFSKNLNPVDRRSAQSIIENKITFVDHHPKKIIGDLSRSGFAVEEYLSVSNFRNNIIKKAVPEKILLFFENILQKPLAKCFFGPSIFLLCKKIN